MTHELNPQHAEIARLAREKIQQHIARLVFGAAETIEPKQASGEQNGNV